MYRFFISSEWIDNNSVSISGEQVHQIRDVLRLKPGDQIVVLDNSGLEYVVELSKVEKEMVTGNVMNKTLCANEPKIHITLYQALLKSDKFKLVLQKCTEIGISTFVPVVCERCVASIPNESRFNRWGKILIESAEQSKRGRIPYLDPPIDLRHACDEAKGLSIMPWEKEESVGIKDPIAYINTPQHINIFVGPEGGYNIDEVNYARRRGIIPVSLGNRILRAETAGLIVAAIVLYESGEMN